MKYALINIGHPSESYQTILDTLRSTSRLPLDYLSFTLPYPIPDAALFERVKEHDNTTEDWIEPKKWSLIRHPSPYNAGFSENKLKFSIEKAHLQFHSNKFLDKREYSLAGLPFEQLADAVFKIIR